MALLEAIDCFRKCSNIQVVSREAERAVMLVVPKPNGLARIGQEEDQRSTKSTRAELSSFVACS
jgi:hypothetical protein